jgi:hypothetical protein
MTTGNDGKDLSTTTATAASMGMEAAKVPIKCSLLGLEAFQLTSIPNSYQQMCDVAIHHYRKQTDEKGSSSSSGTSSSSRGSIISDSTTTAAPSNSLHCMCSTARSIANQPPTNALICRVELAHFASSTTMTSTTSPTCGGQSSGCTYQHASHDSMRALAAGDQQCAYCHSSILMACPVCKQSATTTAGMYDIRPKRGRIVCIDMT